jgi:hypothetical protein
MDMATSFTPYSITRSRRHQLVAGVLLLSFVTTLVTGVLLPAVSTAITTVTWEGDDFTAGATSSTRIKDQTVTLSPETEVVEDTEEEFLSGNFQYNSLRMSAIDEAGIEINQGYQYTVMTNPPVDLHIRQSELADNGVLYISSDLSGSSGVIAINTHNNYDPSDDNLVFVYTPTTTPAIVDDDVLYTTLAPSGLLYVGTRSGMSVIDTKNTISANDDVLVHNYTTASTPRLLDNLVNTLSVTEDGLIYANTWYGGVTVIDTQETLTPTDDVVVATYSASTTPAIAQSSAADSFLFNDLLYIGTTGAGVSVIDTKGTATSSDDTFVVTYATGTSPSIIHNAVRRLFVAPSGLLYVSTNRGVSVIDTKLTTDPGDDLFVTNYSTTSSPAIAMTNVYHSHLTTEGLLYMGGTDLFVVDTKNTITASDDTVVEEYSTQSVPGLNDSTVYHSFLTTDEVLYVSTFRSMSVITPDKFYAPGTYVSVPRQIGDVPTTSITIDSTETNDHTVELSYRLGSSSAYWRNDLTTMTSYLNNQYGLGRPFNTATTTDGVLLVSNPASTTLAYFWIDSGYTANHFATSSFVTARVRTTNATANDQVCIFTDGSGQVTCSQTPNEWITLRHIAEKSFKNIGFRLNNTSAFPPSIGLEVDWVSVTTPDSMGRWNGWNNCTSQICLLPNLGTSTYIQYKLDLETDNPNTTPVVRAISYNDDYHTTGTYQSSTHTFRKTNTLDTFSADVSGGASTSVTFEYSTSDGTTWSSIAPGDRFPKDTNADTVIWRATLSTADGRYTPVITRVTITASPVESSATNISERVRSLHDINSLEAEAVLLEHYPEYFENPDAPLAKQKAIIVLLMEILRLVELLKEIKPSE